MSCTFSMTRRTARRWWCTTARRMRMSRACRAILLRFWMRMAIPPSATATMRGARRCGVPVSWRRRWARCSRSAIAGMCTTKKRGCIICVVGTTIQACADLLIAIASLSKILFLDKTNTFIRKTTLFNTVMKMVRFGKNLPVLSLVQ